MKNRMNHSHRVRQGFTLMELLVTISIILVLASMVVGGSAWYKRKAAEGKTEVLVKSVERALEDYRLDNNAFPKGDGGKNSSSVVYEALYGDPDGDGKPNTGATVYLNTLDPTLTGNKSNVQLESDSYVIVDAWFTPLRYQSPGEQNPEDDFDLYSFGPDGEGGPQGNAAKRRDDIKNW